MTDAIGQPLEIGNFVTAVWANAEVVLFEVVDFKENTKTSSKYFAQRGNVVFLKRLFNNKNIKEETQNKRVKKLVTQVTKVPDDAARDFFMMYKLSN
jgi:dienelactone hydrolase